MSRILVLLAVLHFSLSVEPNILFDGFIERETANSNDDHHTLDFFRVNVLAANVLSIVGTEGTLPDLAINLYRQGAVGELELSGFDPIPVRDGRVQIRGLVPVGNYVLAVLPAIATDWDRFDGLKSNFGVSGQDPPLGLGSYHIDITGDFTVTEILEGHLDIPEPSTSVLAFCAILINFALRRRSRKIAQFLTTSPNELCAFVHDRMLAILSPNDYDRWLDPSVTDVAEIQPLLDAYPADEMLATPVSTHVNNVRNNDGKHPLSNNCIELRAVIADVVAGQYHLPCGSRTAAMTAIMPITIEIREPFLLSTQVPDGTIVPSNQFGTDISAPETSKWRATSARSSSPSKESKT